MGDIAKGALVGAWALLVGWILPTTINLAVLCFTVAPSLDGVMDATRLRPTSSAGATWLLVFSVLFGLILNAMQSPLYRILEGYLLWPQPLYLRRCHRHQRLRTTLDERLQLLRLEREARRRPLEAHEQETLQRLQTSSDLEQWRNRDRTRGLIQRALLQEQLARYPVDPDQIAPTRLGNAIRRFEEYGHDRYRLDTQLLWNELNAAAPEQARRQVDTARTSVDFFVALLYGHAIVTVIALGSLIAPKADPVPLIVTAAMAAALIPIWYRTAVVATDEWAAAVRALVSIGRAPLAHALGLALPKSLVEERSMWTLVSKFTRIPYADPAVALDRFRRDLEPQETQPPGTAGPC
ncbi:hypothetical protein ACFCYF_30585 [Streptomyces chartreusis]|uniref:hypothetical protein n=1 Tax=Streptomyces chartreusis TaxID=1969 RepID=UPI0035E31B82